MFGLQCYYPIFLTFLPDKRWFIDKLKKYDNL